MRFLEIIMPVPTHLFFLLLKKISAPMERW
jgi:hypothetical protein